MQLITKRRMSLHAVAADDVWPTTIGIGGPLPPCYQGSPSSPVWWSSLLSKKRPLTLRAPPLCHVIFATLRAPMEASENGGNGFQKMPRGGLSGSLWLCSIYTLSTLQTGNHLPRAAIRLLLRCIPGNFLQIPLQFLFVR